MVAGLLQHLRAIRRMRDDQGWIKELLDEAENERMHLMTFIQVAKPTFFERGLIMIAQAIFYNFYFFLYLFAPKTAHRVIGYLEEEAAPSYTHYLREIDEGRLENAPASKSPLITGIWRPMHVCETSLSRFEKTKRVTATAITILPTP